MSKKKRRNDNGRIFTPHTPEENKRKIIGVVWRVVSMTVAEQVIPEMRQTLEEFEVEPGPCIDAYEFYAANGADGSHVILLGYGTMFSIQFLHACNICVVEVYHGTLVTDPMRILAWIDELTPRWQEDIRQDRKKIAAVRRTARRLFPHGHRHVFGGSKVQSRQNRNSTAPHDRQIRSRN